MDTVLQNFVKAMELELDNNSRKGSILDFVNPKDILIEIEYHKAKLLLAIKEKNSRAIKEYIADTANFLMALGNSYGLYDEIAEKDGLTVQMKRGIFDLIPVNEQITSSKNL